MTMRRTCQRIRIGILIPFVLGRSRNDNRMALEKALMIPSVARTSDHQMMYTVDPLFRLDLLRKNRMDQTVCSWLAMILITFSVSFVSHTWRFRVESQSLLNTRHHHRN